MSDEITQRGRQRCGCDACLGQPTTDGQRRFPHFQPCPIAAAYVADELARQREDARWDIEQDRHGQVLRSIDALTAAIRGQRR